MGGSSSHESAPAAAASIPTHRRGGGGGSTGGSTGGGGGGGGSGAVLTRQQAFAAGRRRGSLTTSGGGSTAALFAASEFIPPDPDSAPPAPEVVQFPLLPSPPTTLLEKVLAIMTRGDVFTKYSYSAGGAPKPVFVFFSCGPPSDGGGIRSATATDLAFGNLYWNSKVHATDRGWKQWIKEEDRVDREQRRAVLAAAKGGGAAGGGGGEQKESSAATPAAPAPMPVPAGYPFAAPVAASYPFSAGGASSAHQQQHQQHPPQSGQQHPAPAAYPFASLHPSPAAYPFASGGGGGASAGPVPQAGAYPFAPPAALRPLEAWESPYARSSLRSIALVSVIAVRVGAERSAATAARAQQPVVAQDPWQREEASPGGGGADKATSSPNAAAGSSATSPSGATATSGVRFATGSGGTPGSPPASPSAAAATVALAPVDPKYPSQAPGWPSHALSQGFARWTQAPWINVLSFRQSQKRRRERRKMRRRAVREKRMAGMHIRPEEEVSSDSDDDGWLLAGNNMVVRSSGGAGNAGTHAVTHDDDEEEEEDFPSYTYVPPPLSHCLSIATPDRTLDLVARDGPTRDVWAYGLRWLAARAERYFNHDAGLDADATAFAQRMSVAEALGLTQAMRERIQARKKQQGFVGQIRKQVGKVIGAGAPGSAAGATNDSAANANAGEDVEMQPLAAESKQQSQQHHRRQQSSLDADSVGAGPPPLMSRPTLDRTASMDSVTGDFSSGGAGSGSSAHTAIAPSIRAKYGSRYALRTVPRIIATRDMGCEITVSARHLMTTNSSTAALSPSPSPKSPFSPSVASPSSSTAAPAPTTNFAPCILLYGLQRKYIPGVTALSPEKFYASLRTHRLTSSGSEIRGVGLALDERVVFLGKTERITERECAPYASFRATNSPVVPPPSSSSSNGVSAASSSSSNTSTSAAYGSPLSLSPSHPNFVTRLHLARLDDFDEFHLVVHDAAQMDALENVIARSAAAAAAANAAANGEDEGGEGGADPSRGGKKGRTTGDGAAAAVLSPRMLRASLIAAPGVGGASAAAEQLKAFSQGGQHAAGKKGRLLLTSGGNDASGATQPDSAVSPAVSSSSSYSLLTIRSLQACPVVGWLRLKVDDLLFNMGREIVAPLGVPGQPPSIALLTKHFLPPPPTLRSVRALASASAAASMMGRGSVLQAGLSASRGSIINSAGGGDWSTASNDLANSSDMFVKDSEGRTLVTDAMLDAYKVAVLDREARRDARMKVAQAAAARAARRRTSSNAGSSGGGGSIDTTGSGPGSMPPLMRQTSFNTIAHTNVAHNVTVRSQVSPLMLLKITPLPPSSSSLQELTSSSGGNKEPKPRSRNNSNAGESLAAAALVTAAAESAAAAEAATREAELKKRMRKRTPLIYPPGHARCRSDDDQERQRRRVTSLSSVLASPVAHAVGGGEEHRGSGSNNNGKAAFPHRRRHSWNGFDAGLRVEKVLLARPPLPQSDPLAAAAIESSMLILDASCRDTDRGGRASGSSVSSAASSKTNSAPSTTRTAAAANAQQQQHHHIVQIEDLELELEDEQEEDEAAEVESEEDEESAAAAFASASGDASSPLSVQLYPQRAVLDRSHRRSEAPAHSPFPHEVLCALAEGKSTPQPPAAAAAARAVDTPVEAALLASPSAVGAQTPATELLRPPSATGGFTAPGGLVRSYSSNSTTSDTSSGSNPLMSPSQPSLIRPTPLGSSSSGGLNSGLDSPSLVLSSPSASGISSSAAAPPLPLSLPLPPAAAGAHSAFVSNSSSNSSSRRGSILLAPPAAAVPSAVAYAALPASAASAPAAAASSTPPTAAAAAAAPATPAAASPPDPSSSSLGSDDLIASLQARMRKLQEANRLRTRAQHGTLLQQQATGVSKPRTAASMLAAPAPTAAAAVAPPSSVASVSSKTIASASSSSSSSASQLQDDHLPGSM